MRLLLLEDTEDVADAIVHSFGRRGDAVDHAETVAEAVDMIAVQDYDVAILDIGLPDGSGVEVLDRLRARGATPVLMLTARSDVEDRVESLDRGADDYLVKPFDLRELHARVRAMARRQGRDLSTRVLFADLEFDPVGMTLRVSGVSVPLARREFNLLEILLANRGRVVSKERIFEKMFSFNEEDVGINTVEVYTARLRRKLRDSRVSIRTLRGLGYQLVDDA